MPCHEAVAAPGPSKPAPSAGPLHPQGSYLNLKSQVESFGLGHKLKEVKDMYRTVNEMLGDIIKVTPSSKAVGDMAIFMVQNELTPENIYEKAAGIDFPDSIVSYFEGMMGHKSDVALHLPSPHLGVHHIIEKKP